MSHFVELPRDSFCEDLHIGCARISCCGYSERKIQIKDSKERVLLAETLERWAQGRGKSITISALKRANRLVGHFFTLLHTFHDSSSRHSPLVSVVIATYNKPETLVWAIRSILAQSYQRFEVLVVGDACTDDTEKQVQDFNDPRIIWFNRDQNSGSQSLPNNLGLEYAKGKYIAYLGHDDLWLPNHLETLVSEMERRKLDVATTRCFMIGPPGSNALYLSGPGLIGTSRIAVPPSSLCHTKEIVSLAGPWIDYRELPPTVAPDAEFVNRLSQLTERRKSLRTASVIKFNAAWRKGSYLSHNADEQMQWFSRTMNHRRLVRGLVGQALSLELFPRKTTLPTDSLILERGEHIVDGWRRIKGLPPRP